jgi:hypothetical protein
MKIYNDYSSMFKIFCFFLNFTNFFSFFKAQKDLLLKRHRDSELLCETRPHHLPIVQSANKRELDVSNDYYFI